MHSAALLWATALAGEGGASSGNPVSSSSTLPVALIGGASIIVVALIPEFFRWLRRNAVDVAPATVITPAELDAAEARITLALEVRITAATERANAARAEVRALRKAMELRDEAQRDDLQAVRDELNRHLWSGRDIPAPREPAG